MKARKFFSAGVGVVLTLALGLGAMGCARAQPEAAGSDEGSAVEETVVIEDTRPVIGAEVEGCVEVATVQCMGQDVTSMSIRASGEEEYPEPLAVEGEAIVAETEYRLMFSPSVATAEEDVAATDEAADAAGVEVATYDVKVTLADGTEAEFLEVPLTEIQSMTLMFGDEVYYVDFVSLDGTEGSTHDAAVERKAQAEAEAEAQAQAEAEAAAAAEAESSSEYYSSDDSSDDYGYDDSDYYESEESYSDYSDYSGGESSEEGCASDVIFRSHTAKR